MGAVCDSRSEINRKMALQSMRRSFLYMQLKGEYLQGVYSLKQNNAHGKIMILHPEYLIFAGRYAMIIIYSYLNGKTALL